MKTSALRITLGCLTCLALLMTFSNSSAQAPTSPVPPILPQWAVAEPLPPAPEPQMAPLRPGALEPPPPGAGFIPPPMDLSHLTGQRMPEGAVLQPLPDIFDWRNKGGSNYVTSVKNQSTCGSCYSFAAIGNIESKMVISGGIAYPGPDYSENNAKECNWRELNNFQYPNPGDYWGSCDGGNYYMLASLFSQKGTVLETCDPYVASDVTCNSSCPYRKTLLDWHIISDGVPDTNVLKHYIYDNGPVYVSMYADETEGFDNSYDGSFTFNYTTPGPDTNHAVLIVGWSNNLPPVPGDTSPADGWIVKNSWGPTWGDSGYFYITYGAANIGTSSSFMAGWQDYDTNGDIWYYDDDGWWNSYGCGTTTAWGLAKFTPDSNTNVTRVEFWTTDATTDVDVYIYDDFDGTTLSTLLTSKLNNSFGEAGYHSVALDSPLAATSGDDVVAVVKFTNDTFTYTVPVDPHGTIESGRTFLSCSGSSWTDMGTDHSTDVAIRLRTSTSVAPAPTVTSITPASGINTGTVHITDLAGTNFQTGATVKLAKLGQTDIAGASVTVVNSNTITCDFDLTGAATGQWNVVVTNPDLQSGMLPNGFTVNPSPTAPTVTSITPASGVNTDTVHITNLAGTNFQTGATVKLAKLGQTDIAGVSVTVVSSNTITCDFDLTGAATGQWNVVVTNPDLQSGMLPNGFTVNAPGGDTFIYLPMVLKSWPPPQTVSFAPQADTTIIQGAPDLNFGSTSDMWVGYDHCSDGYISRSLVQFDLSSIPAASSVSEATLYVYLVSSCDTDNRTHTATTYRTSSSWSYSAVTWNTQPSIAEAYGSTSIASRTWGWYSFDVTALVRGWVNGSFANYGLMLRGPESSGNDSALLQFYTMNSSASYAPYLDVTYIGTGTQKGEPPAGKVRNPAQCGPTVQDVLGIFTGASGSGAFESVGQTVCPSD